jgi:hypothetical protein
MDNRSHEEADWDLELLGPELEELKGLDFDLGLTGFDEREIEDLLADPDLDDRANQVPDVPEHPVTIHGGCVGRIEYFPGMPPGRRLCPACWASASRS